MLGDRNPTAGRWIVTPLVFAGGQDPSQRRRDADGAEEQDKDGAVARGWEEK